MAENKDGMEKSEDASAKRLLEARLKGQVSKSQDVTTAAVLLIGGLAVFYLGDPLIANYKQFMKQVFFSLVDVEITLQNVGYYSLGLIAFLAKFLLPMLLIVFFVVLAAEFSQVGFKIATKKFTEGLNWKQIFNPFSGLKKIFFSSRSIFELVKSIAKILILGVVVYKILDSRAEASIEMISRPFTDIAIFMAEVSLEMVLKVGSLYIIIALADYFYQKWKFKEDMKMTKHEVKEEHKQTEGNPKVKARLRQIMRQRIRKLMMQNAENADVVITNPTHFAVALSYQHGTMNSPKVVAKGADFLAARIREIADKNDIPIVEDPPLARAIYFNVDIDQEIPENLFKAVAQVLAYVYQLKNKVEEFG